MQQMKAKKKEAKEEKEALQQMKAKKKEAKESWMAEMAEMAEMAGPYPARLLMRSNTQTAFKGVCPNRSKYLATCSTAPCRHHYLGTFGTPEEAAQSHLQHWETDHPEELVIGGGLDRSSGTLGVDWTYYLVF
jgi:hypothetical protein